MSKSVSQGVAEKEVNKWLDFKHVKEPKRESYEDAIEILVQSVMDGTLVLKDDHSFEQTLEIKTDNEAAIDKLIFVPRIRVGVIHKHLQGVKATEPDARIVAYIAALTGQSKGVINGLDTEDYSISSAIAIFFL